MKFFQSKKRRGILLLVGVVLLGIVGYVGYEIYQFNQAMRGLGELMQGLADIASALERFTPDSTAVIDSTQVAMDSISVE